MWCSTRITGHSNRLILFSCCCSYAYMVFLRICPSISTVALVVLVCIHYSVRLEYTIRRIAMDRSIGETTLSKVSTQSPSPSAFISKHLKIKACGISG